MERDRRKGLIVLVLITLLLHSAGNADAGEKKILLLLPASPVSIPVFLAAQKLPEIRMKVFHNHQRAHGLFLRGEARIIVTGFSVGVNMFRQKAPVKIINSFVDRLNYIVGRDRAESFSSLKNERVFLPFPGSPLDELTLYFARSEGFKVGKDIRLGYSPFHISVDLLQSGKIRYAVLPEPFATMAEMNRNLVVSLDYAKMWKEKTKDKVPCLQVGCFINTKADISGIAGRFNGNLKEAVKQKEFPKRLISQFSEKTGFPEKILLRSLERTTFYFLSGNKLKESVYNYSRIMGNPLDERYNEFF